MIPQNVYDLCQNGGSVTAELAKDPTLSPHQACKKLFGIDSNDHVVNKELDLSSETPGDLDQARSCGKWGSSTPSNLFLRVRDPWRNLFTWDEVLSGCADIPRCPLYIGEKSRTWRVLPFADGKQWGLSAHHHGPRS